MDTGWNDFTALNGKANAMFGVNWTSPDKDGKINVISEWFIGNMSSRRDRQAPATECLHGHYRQAGREVALYPGKHRVP